MVVVVVEGRGGGERDNRLRAFRGTRGLCRGGGGEEQGQIKSPWRAGWAANNGGTSIAQKSIFWLGKSLGQYSFESESTLAAFRAWSGWGCDWRAMHLDALSRPSRYGSLTIALTITLTIRQRAVGRV